MIKTNNWGQIARGNVATDLDTWTVRISALQYNPGLAEPDVAVAAVKECGDCSEAPDGPPAETIKCDAKINATKLFGKIALNIFLGDNA